MLGVAGVIVAAGVTEREWSDALGIVGPLAPPPPKPSLARRLLTATVTKGKEAGAAAVTKGKEAGAAAVTKGKEAGAAVSKGLALGKEAGAAVVSKGLAVASGLFGSSSSSSSAAAVAASSSSSSSSSSSPPPPPPPSFAPAPVQPLPPAVAPVPAANAAARAAAQKEEQLRKLKAESDELEKQRKATEAEAKRKEDAEKRAKEEAAKTAAAKAKAEEERDQREAKEKQDREDREKAEAEAKRKEQEADKARKEAEQKAEQERQDKLKEDEAKRLAVEAEERDRLAQLDAAKKAEEARIAAENVRMAKEREDETKRKLEEKEAQERKIREPVAALNRYEKVILEIMDANFVVENGSVSTKPGRAGKVAQADVIGSIKTLSKEDKKFITSKWRTDHAIAWAKCFTHAAQVFFPNRHVFKSVAEVLGELNKTLEARKPGVFLHVFNVGAQNPCPALIEITPDGKAIIVREQHDDAPKIKESWSAGEAELAQKIQADVPYSEAKNTEDLEILTGDLYDEYFMLLAWAVLVKGQPLTAQLNDTLKNGDEDQKTDLYKQERFILRVCSRLAVYERDAQWYKSLVERLKA